MSDYDDFTRQQNEAYAHQQQQQQFADAQRRDQENQQQQERYRQEDNARRDNEVRQQEQARQNQVQWEADFKRGQDEFDASQRKLNSDQSEMYKRYQQSEVSSRQTYSNNNATNSRPAELPPANQTSNTGISLSSIIFTIIFVLFIGWILVTFFK